MTAIPDAPPYPATFWALVEQRTAETPDRPFLEDEGGRTLTFGEYRDAAEHVAAGFHEAGIRSGDLVGWQLPTSLEASVLLAALARLDAVQNPIIPILREREVGFIARQTGAKMLVVPRVVRGFDHEAMARGIAAETGCEVLVADAADGLGSHGLALPDGDPASLPAPPSELAPEQLPVRWIYYSSGTTADPKGARHTDWSVMNGANGEIFNKAVRPDDLMPVPFPLTHIGGINLTTVALMVGCRFLLLEAFDPVESPLLMAERGSTLLGSALPFFRAYIDAQHRHGDEPLFPKLRWCVNGGAPKPPLLHREVQEVLGGGGIMSGWGLTEFPIASTSTEDDTDDQLALTEGKIAPWIEIRSVDLDGNDVGRGAEGELWLKGPQQCRGYLDAELDAHAFHDGWFRTGDLGIVSESGHVQITGRVKDIIIRNAENLSGSEIEGAVGSHPKVADVAVIGLPDDRTGERACAVIVLADSAEPVTLAELGAHCRDQGLAKQKIPEQVEFVDALPRNAMGKVLKRELQKRFDPAS